MDDADQLCLLLVLCNGNRAMQSGEQTERNEKGKSHLRYDGSAEDGVASFLFLMFCVGFFGL